MKWLYIFTFYVYTIYYMFADAITQDIIAKNRAGLIVYLVLLLISHIAFGLLSTKYRFKSYIVFILYGLFAVFCGVLAKFYHNLGALFIIVFVVLMGLYVLTSKGNPFKSLFTITSYLVFFAIFFGITFLILFIEGPFAIAIRWSLILILFAILEAFIYLYCIPTFKKANNNTTKGWAVLFVGSLLYLAIVFMQVFYPFQLNKDNIGGIILFFATVIFYMFVFIIIVNGFATSELYAKEKASNDELKEIAIKDSLTTLYNKNYLVMSKNAIIKANDESTLVCIMDINHFKDINDLYGHMRGDEVLREVAQSIKNIFTQDCYKCFRFGGDEFVIIASNKTIEEMKEQIAILKNNLKESLDITISAGYKFIDLKDIDPLETAIKNADKDMYQEKFINHSKKVK